MAGIIKVKQVRSISGRPEKHKLIVQGLGLRHLQHVRELQDTPSVRGMIRKVQHLVQIVE
ncbi:50S ribosomal protein L30 [Candidatus Magnetaquicoccus inordinatus]|uniref:50S ribosomal protein L30 n=1 Tax=Candidatus Magnetaquicoccus inordinatus TaxID=2496818 RepID=UPI00102B590F|nr:50S ribosomal protein L30 [Candidatus Magnetaquicoccus inordinatus]